MRIGLVVVLVSVSLFVLARESSAQSARDSHLLPPAKTDGLMMPAGVALAVPALLTIGGVVGGAAMDNKPGKWVILSSLVFLPSVGNIALGNNRWAGAFWAMRVLGAGMMLPGLLTLTGDVSVGPMAAEQAVVYGIAGAVFLVVGVFADLIYAYTSAGQAWRDRRLAVWTTPTYSPEHGYGAAAGLSVRF